jgi:hypothetical protein
MSWPVERLPLLQPEDIYSYAREVAQHCRYGVALSVSQEEAKCQLATEEAKQVDLVRCIFGNPFRPAHINPGCLAWNNRTVPKIAETIYDERDFDRLLVLADALEEAGCHDVEILAHCRKPVMHALGCWVLDLLLGKE